MQWLITVNSKVKMESRIVRLFKGSFEITNPWNQNHESQKNKVVSSYLMTLLHDKFLQQEKVNKISYLSIPKISIYLFKHFYFSCFISIQFADFASLKIQMQITFAKLFNVLNNAA